RYRGSTPAGPASSHSSRIRRAKSEDASHLRSRMALSTTARLRRNCLITQQLPELRVICHKLRTALDLVLPRSGQIDGDVCNDAPRTPAHHQDPVSQENSLVNVVSNEDNRCP